MREKFLSSTLKCLLWPDEYSIHKRNAVADLVEINEAMSKLVDKQLCENINPKLPKGSYAKKMKKEEKMTAVQNEDWLD